MSYRKIQAALDTHLLAFTSTDVVFPSTTYQPRHDREFLVAHFLPGQVQTVLLGPGMPQEYRGIYQIDVRGLDVTASIDRIDALRSHFARGMTLTFEAQTLTVDKSEVGPNRGNLKHTNMPLSIFWRSYF